MGLLDKISFRKGIRERLEQKFLNQALGKKERGLGELGVYCKRCGQFIPLDRTSCPKNMRKIFSRNLRSRAIFQIAVSKMNPLCPNCAAVVKEAPIVNSEKEAYDLAKSAVEEAKAKGLGKV